MQSVSVEIEPSIDSVEPESAAAVTIAPGIGSFVTASRTKPSIGRVGSTAIVQVAPWIVRIEPGPGTSGSRGSCLTRSIARVRTCTFLSAIVGPESVRLATTSRPRPAIRNRPSASVTTPSGKRPSASSHSRPTVENGVARRDVRIAQVARIFVTGSPAFFGDGSRLSHVFLGKPDLTEGDLRSGDRPPFEIDQPAVDRQIAGRETDLLILPEIAQAEAGRRRDQSGSGGELGRSRS